ncbi:MAG: class II aldolase/adducin family protein [Burkholderiales bacterium]|nr:class II aldolase/adducin family protein [Anaerolineae bacterium]
MSQDAAISQMRAKIAEIAALMYARQLTDAAGGNVSARVGDLICITSRYAGSKHRWQLKPEQVLVVDKQMNILDGVGEISREAKVHFKLHNEFADAGTSVIHAHSKNVLVFAAMNKSMPPVLEQTLKFGEVPVVGYAAAHTDDLAENIAAALRGNESRIRKQAAGAIAPWHGVFLMGKDLDAAYDALERFDTNAYILLMARNMNTDLVAERQALETAVAAAHHE